MISVCVAIDSMNHPAWNSLCAALKTKIISAKVAKSKSELIGPNSEHEPADEGDVPVRRGVQLLGIDAVAGDGELAGVVEQVVQQDLPGKHREEGQHDGRDRCAEHVPEVARGSHQHVLDGVREDAATLRDTVCEHAEVFVEEEDIGGVLGDIRRGVDRDSDVGLVQGERVVDAVAEEADGTSGVAQQRMSRAFCSGETRAKIVAVAAAACSSSSLERVDVGTGEGAARGEPDVARAPSRRRVRCRRLRSSP